jgi:hypothetical protein
MCRAGYRQRILHFLTYTIFVVRLLSLSLGNWDFHAIMWKRSFQKVVAISIFRESSESHSIPKGRYIHNFSIRFMRNRCNKFKMLFEAFCSCGFV